MSETAKEPESTKLPENIKLPDTPTSPTAHDPISSPARPLSISVLVPSSTQDRVDSPVVHSESLTEIELESVASPVKDSERVPLSADLTEPDLSTPTPFDYKRPDDVHPLLGDDNDIPMSADLTEASIYALMSPAPEKIPDSEPKLPSPTTRNSLLESDFENIDEARFSTVALNINDKRDSTASAGSLHRTGKGHKRNSSSASFMLARVQDSQFRTSVDGQQLLQDEFNRVQESEEDQAETTAAAVDWEFWGAVMADYQTFASENAERLARSIEKGIPDSLRGMVWQLMSASKDPKLEKRYLAMLKESSVHEKAIMRDLGRTFPHHAFFTDGQGIGQENLFNVLKAYSLYDPQVGYCQGLPFVVAILLLNMPDEEAFCLLVRLMESYDLRGHFLPEMPKLQLRLFQFDRLIEELLPVLHVHLLRQGVKSSMYCSHWFLTLFSYRFPHDIVFRIFDNLLASGVEAIFGFSISLLQKNEDKLLTLKFDKLLAFLNSQVFETYQVEVGQPGKYKADEFVQDAVAVKITPFMLDSYAHEYADLVKVRDAHATEMDGLRNSNRNLTAQVQNMEASMTQLNDEHREVLSQLDIARQKNEELESELVRYKFLYAEAMHQSEDALSSHRVSIFTKRGSAGTASS